MILRSYATVIATCLIGTTGMFWLSEKVIQVQQSLDWQTELKQIDSEMQELEDRKNRYLASARRHEDQGMRWQFQQDQKQESKRAYEKADAEKEAAAKLQTRIDALKARKEQILQEHPNARST